MMTIVAKTGRRMEMSEIHMVVASGPAEAGPSVLTAGKWG
jgi:hypothetical protein